MRVLIADDDDVVLTVLQGLLEHLGHETVVARDGTQAWELIQRDDAPSLAIIDWMMPGIDGLEICRRIRQDTGRPYQYLIMLTAKDEMEDLLEGMQSGADDYMRKPFDERELRARLRAGERILAMQDDLRARATFDELTGLLNRATILECLKRELALSARSGAPVSVVLADLDDFKRVNDTHGHPVGDEVLRESTKRMVTRMRSYDDLGRFGGEEFLGVLPACPAAGALAVAERMRHAVGAGSITTVAGPIALTVSFGVATSEQARPVSAEALVAAADEALYRAKRAGRNRVAAALETGPAQ